MLRNLVLSFAQGSYNKFDFFKQESRHRTTHRTSILDKNSRNTKKEPDIDKDANLSCFCWLAWGLALTASIYSLNNKGWV